MSSNIFFILFVPILALILLGVNLIFAPHLPYKEKKTPFECGYHSFLGQSRSEFGIAFFVFGLMFMLFDLEIVATYPFAISVYTNAIYGTITVVTFALIVTFGLIYELGKGALKIESKQDSFI